MPDKSAKHRGRYDVLGNAEAEYVDPANTVLVNKKGIVDLNSLQTAEEEGLARAYATLIAEVRTDTPMTATLVRHIHGRIFGDLYDWAGHWRTVWISKPGVTWPPPDFLDKAMAEFEQQTLKKNHPERLETDDAFCDAAGEIQGEFLVIHPFREGNARTIKLMTDLLAAQTGRPLLVYNTTAAGVEEYIDAAKAAFKKQYEPMVRLIRQALDHARR